MKKYISLFLIGALVLCCTACQAPSDAPAKTVTVYYRAQTITFGTESGVIAPYPLDTAEGKSDIAALLNAYFANTPTADASCDILRRTRLVSLDFDALTAKIVLSDEFAALRGHRLSIACAALTQTVISLTDCQEVIISAENARLDGRNFLTLTRDSYLLLDESGDPD